MIKKIKILLLVFIASLSLSSVSFSQQAGVGIIVGEPVGISWKTMLTEDNALSGAFAWSFADEKELHIHADWLFHNWSVLQDAFEVKSGKLPLYYGIGGRIKLEDDTRVGIRFVIGMSYIFENAPVDIFMELAPIMDIAPSTELNGNIGLGARFWLW